MTTLRNRRRGLWLLFVLVCLMLVASLCAGCTTAHAPWKLAENPRSGVIRIAAPRFVVLADTQYSVPGTEYDVNLALGGLQRTAGPGVSSNLAGSFYRHAGANHVLPYVMDDILKAEEQQNTAFGIFLGDMLEFACEREADKMFAVLNRHPKLPFVIALGNHDAVFHGSWDTDAIGLEGNGPLDQFGFALWGSVCEAHGGPLSKPDFIDRVIDYYASSWKLDIKGKEGISGKLPPDITFENSVSAPAWQGTTQIGVWTLEYSVRVAPADRASSHRQSHFWQRLRYSPMAADSEPVTLTVLDSTDFAGRPIGCGALYGKLGQVGVKGSVSVAQLAWLAELGAPGDGEHLVLSHYLPFFKVEGEGDCDVTCGTECGFSRRLLPAWGDRARFLYAHVHAPFRAEIISGSPDDGGERRDYTLFRFPSLIDNHQYAVLDKNQLAARDLPVQPYIESRRPFSGKRLKFADLLKADPHHVAEETCHQRFSEYVELERNLACFAKNRGLSSPWKQTCDVSLADANDARKAEAASICPSATARGGTAAAQAWKSAHPAEWKEFSEGSAATADCSPVPAEHWRCIVRGLGLRALAKLEPQYLGEFARAQLASTKPTPD